MTIKRITQLELEDFVVTHEIENDSESGKDVRALSAQEVRERSMAARQALPNDPDWADGYHKLINAGWPWRMAAWVAWSSIPKGRRWPKTQNELAVDVLGLTSDRTIATWRKKFPALDQLIADLQADDLLDARADVMTALKDSASTPNYKHSPDRRLYLTLTGDYVERKKIDLTNKKAKASLRELSDKELDALSGDPAQIKALLEQLRAEESDEDLDDALDFIEETTHVKKREEVNEETTHITKKEDFIEETTQVKKREEVIQNKPLVNHEPSPPSRRRMTIKKRTYKVDDEGNTLV